MPHLRDRKPRLGHQLIFQKDQLYNSYHQLIFNIALSHTQQYMKRTIVDCLSTCKSRMINTFKITNKTLKIYKKNHKIFLKLQISF